MLTTITWVDLAAFGAALVGACGAGYWFGFRDGRVDVRLSKLEQRIARLYPTVADRKSVNRN